MIEEEIRKSKIEIRQGHYELFSEISSKQAELRRSKLIDKLKATHLAEK